MKLTKNLEAEIKQVLDTYWDSYLKGDLKKWASFLPDHYRNIGTTQEEIWDSKKDIVDYTKRVIDQMVGMAELRNKEMEIIPYEPYIMVHEIGDMFIKTENNWTFYAKLRLSSLLEKTTGGWKILHQHGSYPDSKTEEGETFAFDKISKENLELKEAVKRRTIELEIKNRELEIEAALERVRVVAMGMIKDDDLRMVCEALYKELKQLGFKNIRNAQAGIIDAVNKTFKEYSYSDYGSSITGVITKYSDDPLSFELVSEIQQSKDAFFKKQISGDEFENWRRWRLESGRPYDPLIEQASSTWFYIYSIGKGGIGISTLDAITEQQQLLLKRFKNVFELTYTRFLDLQKAEAQAREAKTEAALEKVRSRTMAMQKSEELSETSFVLFQQLKGLGVVGEQISIGIYKEEERVMDLYATIYGNQWKDSARVQFDKHDVHRKTYAAWKEQKKSLVVDLSGEALDDYNRFKMEETPTQYKSKDMLPKGRWVIHIAFFSKGCLFFSANQLLSKETIQLLERFAGVFDLTYTRFLDLKKAEAHAVQAEADLEEIKLARQKAEEALTELQNTQKQLIQSEKMASLGELTAGIAHEIQNPLNFVNNFSEVNSELVVEMQQELEKGNLDDAKLIAKDIFENEQKINHHGKRADAIVKGMLQHSRSSSGIKEPTDINALAEEYLRLAYHGLRAKDNSFNATMKTELDSAVGLINVIPQDIGRVILNLITNAFYAVNDKKKFLDSTRASENAFEPTVYLETKKFPNKIEIRVKDNGIGIPGKILDKIFQPFFTTKSTGQGTGLGLSLSYDIVKAHGGRLEVQTIEGEGSTFIIQLQSV